MPAGAARLTVCAATPKPYIAEGKIPGPQLERDRHPRRRPRRNGSSGAGLPSGSSRSCSADAVGALGPGVLSGRGSAGGKSRQKRPVPLPSREGQDGRSERGAPQAIRRERFWRDHRLHVLLGVRSPSTRPAGEGGYSSTGEWVTGRTWADVAAGYWSSPHGASGAVWRRATMLGGGRCAGLSMGSSVTFSIERGAEGWPRSAVWGAVRQGWPSRDSRTRLDAAWSLFNRTKSSPSAALSLAPLIAWSNALRVWASTSWTGARRHRTPTACTQSRCMSSEIPKRTFSAPCADFQSNGTETQSSRPAGPRLHQRARDGKTSGSGSRWRWRTSLLMHWAAPGRIRDVGHWRAETFWSL